MDTAGYVLIGAREPKTGDRGPVKDAVAEIVDAAGGLEYSRVQLCRAMAVAQEEFDVAASGFAALRGVGHLWGGRNTPPVYYEFCNVVAWTRAIGDRYGDRLHPAVKHDLDLWIRLQKLRSQFNAEFDDARLLAQCGLHKYTPPYPLAGGKVTGDGTLIYLVPVITNADDFRANLQSLTDSRHVASVTETFWTAVSRFVEGLLDVFYPR